MDTKPNPFKETSSNPTKSEGLRAQGGKRRKTAALEMHSALRRLQQWAANTPPTKLTREQAAAIASREPHYLSYLFRREMGKTFVNWRREYRTSVALAALEEGTYSINEIVRLVGYRSRRSLERAVKGATGRTAGSFKRRRQNQEAGVTSVSKEST
jgi:methylphosphotriester-DNA--protein-cysteine methyltransferase